MKLKIKPKVKKLIALTTLLITTQLMASSFIKDVNVELKCSWQKSPLHAQGFYKPATFHIKKAEKRVSIIEDTFLRRSYNPCWIKSISRCFFSFDYDRSSNWSVHYDDFATIKMSAPGFYWSAEIQMDFDQELETMTEGSTVKMMMSGDDGDGVSFLDEEFSCLVLEKEVVFTSYL